MPGFLWTSTLSPCFHARKWWTRCVALHMLTNNSCQHGSFTSSSYRQRCFRTSSHAIAHVDTQVNASYKSCLEAGNTPLAIPGELMMGWMYFAEVECSCRNQCCWLCSHCSHSSSTFPDPVFHQATDTMTWPCEPPMQPSLLQHACA